MAYFCSLISHVSPLMLGISLVKYPPPVRSEDCKKYIIELRAYTCLFLGKRGERDRLHPAVTHFGFAASMDVL